MGHSRIVRLVSLALTLGCVYSFDTCRAQLVDRSPRILIVTPEQTSIFQTGGLAHASTGLARSLNDAGYAADVLMPYYLEMKAPPTEDTRLAYSVDLDFREGAPHKSSVFSLVKSENQSPTTYFLKHVNRDGENNYFDNRNNGSGKKFYAPDAHIGESFGAYDHAAEEFIISQNYDVVILNDWSTGLIAYYLKQAKETGRKVPKVVFAIHNLAYQGHFPRSLADFLGIPETFSTDHGIEFWGQLNFLKAGLQYSDMIYTVSQRYASEIAMQRFGAGLDGLIQKKMKENRVTGILNGIINEEWDPRQKRADAEWTFTHQDFTGKARGKAELQKDMNLPVNAHTPLFVLTSRIAEQKGFEYLIDAIAQSASTQNAQWLITGDGDEQYISKLKELQHRFPERVAYRPFSTSLELRGTRYADFFVNGAWFEPSGLNQLFSMRNGTIPVVSNAGGLADSVKNGKTGFLFDIAPGQNHLAMYDKNATAANIVNAVRESIELFNNPEQLQQMRTAVMQEDHSWQKRIDKEFRALFNYVMEDGPSKLPFWQNPTSFQAPDPISLSAAVCSQTLAGH